MILVLLLTGTELLRTGDRVRRVLLNPSRKFSLLLVGLGVRDESWSKPTATRDRCKSDVVVAVVITAAAAANAFVTVGPETTSSFPSSFVVLGTFGVDEPVEDAFPRHGDSGLTPRLYASKL